MPVQAIIKQPLFSETARQESNVERFIANTVAGDEILNLRWH